MPRPTRDDIEKRMATGEVPGVSIAYLAPSKAVPIESVVIGKTDKHSTQPIVDVEENTVFGAASLSKPVFSYLVLKLIADEKLSTTDGKPFDLDTPISEILSITDFYEDNLDKEVSRAFAEEAKGITARMVLSHTTGIPISGAPRLDFEPGTQYAYGNTALNYLQKAIEEKTGKSLGTLAQEEVFTPLKMTHSNFLPPTKEGESPKKENAANSLHTTASDYARFAEAWMNEKECGLVKTTVVPTTENQKNAASSRYILTETGLFYYNQRKYTVQAIKLHETQLADLQQRFAEVTETKPIDKLSNQELEEITTLTGHTNPLQEAFRPAISLTQDQWAIDMNVPEKDRQHLAWGLGLGLQLDDKGEVVTAFHSGDMNQWRGWVAMDVNAKTAVVYFANGNDTLNGSGHGYGHVLADVIVDPEVKLTHGLNWFFKKFGVSRNVDQDWKAKEEADTARIGLYVNKRLSSPPATSSPRVLTDEEVDKAKLAAVEHGLKGDYVEGEQPGMALLDRMAHHRVPDVSMAIIDGDTITPVVHHLSSSTEQAASVETRFQAGSISKLVTAVIALKLWQDGKLYLDRDVNKQLKDWQIPYNAASGDEVVTLRQLLSHTAGLTMSGFPGYSTTTNPSEIPTNLQILNAPATLAIIAQWPPTATEIKAHAPGYFLVKNSESIELYKMLTEELYEEKDYQKITFDPKLLDQISVLEAEAATHPDKKVIMSREQMDTMISTGEYDPTVAKPLATRSFVIEPYTKPGTEFQYSGGGTQIIQQLIVEAMEDKATGKRKTFAEIADEMVFKPLAMENSTFDLIWPTGEDSELASSVAEGHQEDGTTVPGGWRMHPESAAAGLWTTPVDLAKLVIGIQRNAILFRETTAEMLGSQVDNGPCGLGPFLNPEAHEFSHEGIILGYRASFIGFSTGLQKGAIIMTNSNNGNALIDELNHSIAATYDWPSRQTTTLVAKPINAAILSPLVGVYDFPAPDGLIEVTLSQKEDQFFLSFPDPNPTSAQVAHELKQASDNLFFVKMSSGEIVPLFLNQQNQLGLFGRDISKRPVEPTVANAATHDSPTPVETTAFPNDHGEKDSAPAPLSSSWAEQEQLEKPIILKKFWEERVLHPENAVQKAFSINAIKDSFLLALPKPGMTETEWKEKVDEAWANGSAFASKEAFYEFFEHIDSAKAVGIAEGLIPIAEPSQEAIRVTPDEIDAIKQYTQDKDLTISAVIGSVATGIEPCCSENYSTADVFSMHSISKVFTGVLALRLLEEGVIAEDDLKTPPIQLAPSTRQALSAHPQILARLHEVNLHQALTHNAGLGVADADVKKAPFGDYYGNYIDAVEKARRNKTPLPEIRTVEDFIPFIPDQTTAAGPVGGDKKHYSNSGIVLAALSLLHLYNERRDKTREPEPLSFDDIMKKYVTGPTAANMSCFQASSQGLTVSQNSADPIASDMVGSPGGGYFSTAQDLGKFAQWMHHKCQDSAFVDLISQYGQEFCPKHENKTIEHTGDGADSSGFFSLNWETGNLVIVLNDQRAIAASEVGREIQDHIFSQPSAPTETRKTELTSNEDFIAPTPVPAWQTKLINEIIAALAKNFINFNKDGKTEANWKSKLTEEFKNHFALLASEQDFVEAYRAQFQTAPTLYLIPPDETITQDFVTENIPDSNAVILHGEGDTRSIYCVINGQLSQDNLFHGDSLSSIKIPENFISLYGQIDSATPGTTDLIAESLNRAAYSKFAEEVTLILATISQDEHMSLGYYPDHIEARREAPLFATHKQFSQNTPLDMEVSDDILDRLKRAGPDFGFSTRPAAGNELPDEIGYLRIGEVFNLPDPQMADARAHVFHIMEQFQDKEAIILDLQDCGGGTPAGVNYLAGFFFNEPQHLSTYFNLSDEGEIQRSELITKPPLKADGTALDLFKKPLYILINEKTFSAAEELAYDLQQLKGATLIGTKTAGGNHFTRGEPLLNQDKSDCDHRFTILIPRSYSINPVSETNWEDGPISRGEKPGVVPDVSVSPQQNPLSVALNSIPARSRSVTTASKDSTSLMMEKLRVQPAQGRVQSAGSQRDQHEEEETANKSVDVKKHDDKVPSLDDTEMPAKDDDDSFTL